ncbi:MAG: alpha-ribazole phosphatase [Melioribacteraceae bacterium]|nr:MAG: alpha-ribazole phosphatase [Melioribacteraceae bacterium]
MEIYLIRHTKPEIENGICYGQSDIDLSPSFENEFQNLMQKIPSSFNIIFSSPLKRCSVLAGKLHAEKLIYDNLLMELNFGKWEMTKWNDIDNSELNNWMNNYVDTSPPDGENYKQLFERVKQFWDTNFVKLKEEKIAVVAHAGAIRAVLAIILELELQKTFMFSIDYGKTIKVDFTNNYYSIKYINY